MQITGKINNIEVEGEVTSKKATLNQDKITKLQWMLTKALYQDPQSATVVEWTNNAIDSIILSGKNPLENPAIVEITNSYFRVSDKGIGLDKNDFETVCMSYLSSTKEQDNNQIGCFGLGMKAFLSLNKSATFICRKSGVEYKFIAYEGSEFMECDLIYEKPTSEENGVICEIPLDGWYEYESFYNKAVS